MEVEHFNNVTSLMMPITEAITAVLKLRIKKGHPWTKRRAQMAMGMRTPTVISTERSMAKNMVKTITTKNNPMTRTLSRKQKTKTKLKRVRILKSHQMQMRRTNWKKTRNLQSNLKPCRTSQCLEEMQRSTWITCRKQPPTSRRPR